ncbi:MAG: helicase HerA-like domain-containing protein [Myxococcota bacterium]|nr:helicase HerA-like domain-containing protein [Myxococcota bacterium]
MTLDAERDGLDLGADVGGETVSLPTEALLRHVMALGASGSGKTVFCKVVAEEALLAGLPTICVDPQGDLCSLAAGTLDDAELEARGIDPARAARFRELAEVVIFTPGARVGVPLCADPVDPGLAAFEGAERAHAVSRTAAVVVGLLGFDLDQDDGAGLSAAVDRALHAMIEAGAPLSLAGLTDHLHAAEQDGFGAYARFLDARKLRTANQRLARLDVGARRLLFHDGLPLDVETLVRPSQPGKVRVAVIYLNTLHAQEDKDFFVAAVVDRLYGWMLAHPSAEPQLLFYIDEVAPFVPPVRKPACKDGLTLLFKQARKYGVCCVMATQNPGDVDYRAMAQFGTWALGRLTTRQDLKKIEPTLKSLAPDASDALLAKLPALEPGQLVLLNPDRFDTPIELRTRWLLTRHETWGLNELGDHPPVPLPVPLPAKAPEAATDPNPEPEPETEAEAEAETETEAEPEPEPTSPEPEPTSPDPEPAPPAPDLRALLSARPSATVKALAPLLGKSESATRRALRALEEEGAARSFRVGRTQHFFDPARGLRPDLGMLEPVPCLVAHVSLEDAAALGERMARSRLFGLIGEDERFARAEPLHRLVWQLDFEERVERSLLSRLFGDAHDEKLGSVYVHPHNLGVLVFTNEDGVRFDDRPTGSASAVRDFDGVTERCDVLPGALALEDADWTERRGEGAVKESFAARFDARPLAVRPLFVPLWNLLFQTEAGSYRRVTLDGLVGRPVRWLPPGGRP